MAVALLCGLLVVFIFFYWTKIVDHYKLHKFPKLPIPYYPIVGHVYNLPHDTTKFFHFFNKVCNETAMQAKRKMAVFWVGWRANIFVIHPDSAGVLLKSTTNIRKSQNYDYVRPWLRDGLISSTGEKWHKRRKLVTPSFHFDLLKDSLYVMNEQTSVFIDNVEKLVANGRNVDIQQLINLLTLDIITETAMGYRCEAQTEYDNEYVQSIQDMNEYVHQRTISLKLKNDFYYNLTPTGRKQKKSVNYFKQFTRDMVEKRMADQEKGRQSVQVRKSYLDVLLAAKSEDGSTLLSVEDIQEEVDTYMFAGHGTASFVYVFAFYILGRNPEKQRKLQEELDSVFGDDRICDITTDHLKDLTYLDLVVKEAMRLFPADVFIGRKTVEECVVEGYTIPKDQDVTINIYYIHRHPDIWENPNEFIPERFTPENRIKANRPNYSYIPFSAGPRNCVAQRFALQEEKIILAKFFRKFSLISHDAEEDLKINCEISFQLDQKLSVSVKLRPLN